MYIYWFSSDQRVVTDADDDDADNAGRHSTTTRATYRKKSLKNQLLCQTLISTIKGAFISLHLTPSQLN